MNSRAPLTLHEEILLLALDDEKGTTATGAMFAHAMGGAILAELVVCGAVQLSPDKKKTATALPTVRVDDPILGEALALIAAAKKPKSARDWVLKFAGLKDLKHRSARQLVAKGVLREEEGTVLLVFKRALYPEVDGGPERRLIARLERAIFTETADLDQGTLVIIALARATKLLPRVIDKERLKTRKERLKQLTSGQVVGQATAEAVAAIQAAIMVATMVPVIAASTSSSH
jgi:hypothetical protein